jgi:hypothetical protein
MRAVAVNVPRATAAWALGGAFATKTAACEWACRLSLQRGCAGFEKTCDTPKP